MLLLCGCRGPPAAADQLSSKDFKGFESAVYRQPESWAVVSREFVTAADLLMVRASENAHVLRVYSTDFPFHRNSSQPVR